MFKQMISMVVALVREPQQKPQVDIHTATALRHDCRLTYGKYRHTHAPAWLTAAELEIWEDEAALIAEEHYTRQLGMTA